MLLILLIHLYSENGVIRRTQNEWIIEKVSMDFFSFFLANKLNDHSMQLKCHIQEQVHTYMNESLSVKRPATETDTPVFLEKNGCSKRVGP